MNWSDSDDDLLLSAVAQTSVKPKAKAPTRKLSQSQPKVKKFIQTTSSKKNAWVSSSFDDFGDDFSKSQPNVQSKGKLPRKRTRESSDEKKQSYETESSSHREKFAVSDDAGVLWADKHSPNTVSELAVHKKKIQEVQGLLEHCFNAKSHQAPVILLTGPSGCGKTACLKVLCKECCCEVQEWINPVTSSYTTSQRSWEDTRDFTSVGMSASASQASLFQDFILRANKYPTLSIFNQDQLYRKIILVEDFPNIFFRDVSQFHQILRSYQKRGHSPLVFIVSDSVAGDSNERLLFPKHIQAELNISNISFNPVAQTSLTKVLQRIASSEASKQGNKRKFQVPDKATVESLASSSNGDIRGAINALQFTCLKGESGLLKGGRFQTKSSKHKSKQLRDKFMRKAKDKSRSKDTTSAQSIGGKDTSLFIFRALGKILYCKRDAATKDAAELPSHLSQHYRDPLLVDPEDVLEKSHLSSEFFSAYLHQNYPEFYSSIDDIVMASDYVSHADYLTAEWTNRSVLSTYSASIAARGIMFANTDRATQSSSIGSKLGWKPLHKPQWFDVNKKIRDNISSAQSLFTGQCTPVELQTVLIPYMSVINPPATDHVRANFIREVGRMPRYCRSSAERLDEKDLSLLSTIDDTPNDQSLMLQAESHTGSIKGGLTRNQCSQLTDFNGEDGYSGTTFSTRSSDTVGNVLGDVTIVEGRAGEESGEDFVIEDFDD